MGASDGAIGPGRRSLIADAQVRLPSGMIGFGEFARELREFAGVDGARPADPEHFAVGVLHHGPAVHADGARLSVGHQADRRGQRRIGRVAEQVEAIVRVAILDEQVADLNVRFRRGKSAQELDTKQGRVVVEQSLLDYARIDRQVEAVRVGAYWRVGAPEHIQ